ncbi:MAG: DUF2202 domain-containing protein [Nanoarchaeota archaeon]|nr:DUF2202 domain-containing protein [Nanoarchaeota archaeon]
MKKIILAIFVIVVLSMSVFAQSLDAGQQQQLIDEHVEGGTIENLSQAEINGLLLMREEEKLARDVYLELYDEWNIPIFNNIAASEQTHTNAVKVLLEAYEIEDPVTSDARGDFVNEELKNLYEALVASGKESLLDALIVGATVEDLDIKDLNELLEGTENEDIVQVYENLRKGSRNHIRSFMKQIENNEGSYEAVYISTAELDSILGSDQERGPLLDEDSSFIPNFQSQLRLGRKGVDAVQVTKQTRTETQVTKGDGEGTRLRDGTYQNQAGKEFSLRQEGNRRMMQSGGRSVDCSLCDEMTQEDGRLNARLSNGKNAEIKVMPDAASETALQRLRLKNCNEGCSIELKEVSVKNQVRAAYEVKTQRNSKVLGLFKKTMDVQAQVDAETGEVIQVGKPWWAFLASEAEE